MKFTATYNNDLCGVILKDENADSTNFQFEKCVSNHPEPSHILKRCDTFDEMGFDYFDDDLKEKICRELNKSFKDVRTSFDEFYYDDSEEKDTTDFYHDEIECEIEINNL